MIRAAVAGLLLLAGAAVPATAAPVVVLAPQPIAVDATYEDATIVVAGTVTVSASASLAIRRSRIVAVPGSALIVEGALEMTDVDGEGLGIVVTGTATLTRTRLSRSAGDLIAIDGGTLAADDVELSGAGIIALRASQATITAAGLDVIGTNGYGIRLADSTLDASGLTISSAADYGFFAERSSISITDSVFRGHCGAYLSSGTTGSMRETTFDTLDHGLTLFRSGAVSLRDLTFGGGSDGLSAVGVTLDVAGITATGLTRAIVAIDSGGLIDGGRLSATTAVETGGATVPAFRSLDLSSSPTGVRNTSPSVVDARWNWWGGAPNTAGAAAFEGSVDAAPWLTAAPA